MDSKPLLVVGSRVMETQAFARVRKGHMFRRRDREEPCAGVSYFFTDLNAFSSARDYQQFEIVSFQPEMISAVAVVEAAAFHFYLTRSEFVRIRGNVPDRFRASFTFEQHPVFTSLYDRKSQDLLGDMGPYDCEFPFPDGKDLDPEVVRYVREWAEVEPCEHCGAVLVRGMPTGFCCRPFEDSIRDHLPHELDAEILSRILELAKENANFPRLLNRDLRPVIQNAEIRSPHGPAANLFISGIPYAIDTFRQFVTPVYAVFDRCDRALPIRIPDSEGLIAAILDRNPILREYLRGRLDSVVEIALASMPEPDPGMNLGVFNADGEFVCAHEIEAVRSSYETRKLCQHIMLYDKLVYPLIFWDGHGGCGSADSDESRRVPTLIRKSLIALCLQDRGHFIHKLQTLREEFICAISGRLSNMRVQFLAKAQRRYFAREDEIRDPIEEDRVKEYGMRTFIPSSLTDSNEYWRDVATKCFALSTQLGAPTFFLTFTMNPYWLEFQALKRGDAAYSDSAMAAIIFRLKLNGLMKFIESRRTLGKVLAFVWRIEYQKRGLPHAHVLFWTDYDTSSIPAVEKVVNVRLPKDSPFQADRNMTCDFRILIEHYQMHKHSKRCWTAERSCRFGYPQPVEEQTVIRRYRYVMARDEAERNVVPHNPAILAAFRCHHCLEVIHSDQCIGYVLKYCSKNSDDGQVSLDRVRYEGRSVSRAEKLEYFAASRISSACECFAGICGYWRHHMKPAVTVLNIHLEGKKVVLALDRADEQRKADIPSRLERYFGRPATSKYDDLTYTDYYSKYVVDVKSRTEESDRDQCDPPHFVTARKKPMICIINSVNVRNRELFALRLLLRLYPAQSWEGLRTRDGQVFPSWDMTIKYLGLIRNTDDEARISMRDAIEMGRPPSDLRFLLAQIAPYVSNRRDLECEFWQFLFDIGDTDDSVRRKLDEMLHPQACLTEAMSADSDDEPLACLTEGQRDVALQIIDGILNTGEQLFFLQGSAGTGKTYTVKALMREMARRGRTCLITATTGIAAVQYPGGTTVHSLFKLGIDESVSRDFRCNIGRDTWQARHILSADLIVIDEVSMLTPWVANRISLTLRSISDRTEVDFGGKRILFVGDLLQLPPVVKGFSTPVPQRLITRLSCWSSIRKLRLTVPVKTPDRSWADFLMCVAVGRTHDFPTWNDVAKEFGVTVTDDPGIAETFFCEGLQPEEPFPLDRQWICPTNKISGEVNACIQSWTSTRARFLGTISAVTDLLTPLPESPGLSACQQVDFIERFDTPDLPVHRLVLFAGDALVLLRNLDTRVGLAKGRRCSVKQLRQRTIVVEFDDGSERTLARIPMEKVTNGMKFQRWQIPVRLMFAGTVHRSQGMTLARAVVDYRSQYWEHGQLYVALSRVRNPRDLCILVRSDATEREMKVPVDLEVVRVVESMIVTTSTSPARDSVVVDETVVSRDTMMDGSPGDGASEDDFPVTMVNKVRAAGVSDMESQTVGQEPDIGSEHFENEGDVLDLPSMGRNEIPVQNVLRAAVRGCRGRFCEIMKDKRPSFALMNACVVARVLLARFLAIWRYLKRIESLQRPLCDASDIGYGLLNTSSNCYVNAFLQVIYHITPLRRLVLSWESSDWMVRLLQRVFSSMERKRLVSPAGLAEICEPGVHGQKDCYEFALNLLDALSNRSVGELARGFRELIRFEIRHVVSCSDQDRHTVDPPYSILVVHNEGFSSLEQSLASYFATRSLDAEDRPVERLWIQGLPKFLLIQIARERWIDGKLQKDCRYFQFPVDLDMTAYAYQASGRFRYHLEAVVAHLGRSEDGITHYVTFCWIATGWVCFNDASVHPVSQNEAVNENFPDADGSTQTATMPMYVSREGQSCIRRDAKA
jgi:hypothetical protein